LSRRRFLAAVLGAAGAAACGVQSQGATSSRSVGGGSAAPNASQIVVAVEGEPRTLVPAVGGTAGSAAEHLFELVHQSLVAYDDMARPIPRVARALPSLDDGTWKVYDDGTMDTVWTLRDNVYWHDGRPFTANDVVFSWQLFNDPALPVISRRVARLIDSIDSPDPHTVVMHWRGRYAFADQITWADLTLLPSHLLTASFELRREQIAGHPYWRNEFVGLGPYRVQSWPAGNSIQLTAADDYFLGPPSNPEIAVRFLPDDNAAMAAVLSGAVDLMLPRRSVYGIVRSVRDRWASGDEGTLSVLPGYSWAYLAPQFMGPTTDELQDVRLRQALTHALDRPAIAEVVTGDRALASDLWIPTNDPRYDAIAGDMAHQKYDPNRARELFREAGWRREGPTDTLVKEGRRLEIELTTTTGWERAAALVADYWRDVGVTVREDVRTLGAIVDRQARATYTGVELAGAAPNFALLDGRLHSTNMPAAENQWVGANRGHYRSSELDLLIDRLWLSFDRSEREAIEREVARHISTELPIIGLFFYPAMVMTRSSVHNARPPTTVAPVGRPLMSWNAHEWVKSG
jgi:peptide/nickel transport system substrate-binding protein